MESMFSLRAFSGIIHSVTTSRIPAILEQEEGKEAE